MISRQLVITVIVLLAAALMMGFYAGRIRAHMVRSAEQAQGTHAPVAPPAAGPTETVTLYVAFDDSGSIRPRPTQIPLSGGRQQRAEGLLRALLAIYLERPSPHVLPPGSDVRGVYIVATSTQTPTIAVVDLNQAVADGHRSGVLVEELTVASIVQTLTANLDGIQEVKILVEGKERDTLAGHADLSNMFDAAAVSRMMANQVSTSDVADLR